MRHLFGVEILHDRSIGGRAERAEDRQHLLLLDELAYLLHGARRTVPVIEADELDLAAVDAATLVDHAKESDLRLAVRPISRSGPAVRHRLAELDAGVGDAGAVALLRVSGGEAEQQTQQLQRANAHGVVLICSGPTPI